MNQNTEVKQIPIEDIVPNRFQPRISFDEKALNDLANSIKQHGIIQPLVVRRLNDKYEIIAGERRYKAAQIAGLISVPALVADVNDESSAEIALVENVQRKDLSSIEEAKSYKNILDKSDMTQEELAKKMGLSQSSVANKLRLLNLNDEVQKALLDGKISERHARSLLAIEDSDIQNELLKRIIDERLTVKQLDEEIKKIKRPVRDDVIDDVPLVDINENLEQMQKEATDINTSNGNIVNTNENNYDEVPTSGGKFFKVSIPDESESTSNVSSESTPPNVASIPSDFSFFNFDQNDNENDLSNIALSTNMSTVSPSDMIVEEVLDSANSDIPTNQNNPSNDMIETLDIDSNVPDNQEFSLFDSDESEEPTEVDLPTIINKVRNLINQLNSNKNIKISEIDGESSYKIEIEIEKDL